MNFSIVRIDKKKVLHLSLKPAEWFFQRIQTDTKSGTIGKLRRHIADYGDTGNYERQNPMAMVLPSVELAKDGNGNLKIVAFNGLVTLHVGGLMTAEDIEAVKNASKMLPMTFAALKGADGRSAEILVAVAQKSNILLADEEMMNRFCADAYEVAFGVYSGILQKTIERQAVTVRSAFRMTLDESPYYHPEATPLQIDMSLKKSGDADRLSSAMHEGHEQRDPDMMLYSDYERMYRRASEDAYDEVADVVESQRQQAYITELFRRLCEMGVPEEEAFVHVQNHHKFSDLYDADECRAIASAVYSEFRPQRRKEGDMVSRETRRMIRFLTTRYVFRFNQVLGYTEYRPNNTWIEGWQPCDENAINGMTIAARLENLDVRDKDVRRYVHSNMIRQSDPIEDYLLRARDKWDGKTDHIAMLARTVPCDIPQWETWFKKWFLYMVAQWVLPTQEFGNSIVPLLISPQGDGKSAFCRSILPKELSWGFQENQDVNDKRGTLMAMHHSLLINLDEFNGISQKVQESFLKNIIQLPSVKIKRPYGKHVEEFRRYASFISTTNEMNVLSDPTGNRRFICVRLTAPIDTSAKPNYEALYGQAYTIVTERRMQWWFEPEEVKQIMTHNRSFEIVPPVVQYFREHYEIPEREEDGVWLSPTNIYERLRKVAGSGLKANGVAAFGRYLNNMPHLQHRRTASGMLYLVKEK